ncbi:unnamed protein product [Prunus brigantina]
MASRKASKSLEYQSKMFGFSQSSHNSKQLKAPSMNYSLHLVNSTSVIHDLHELCQVRTSSSRNIGFSPKP